MAFRPRLRTILLALSLIILLLPIGGIAILRLYENELVKQTETELIGQAAVTAAAFREAYLSGIEKAVANGQIVDSAHVGNPLAKKWMVEDIDGLTPLLPQLDLANVTIMQPAGPARTTAQKPDPLAVEAGRSMIPILKGAKKIALSGIRIVDYQGIVVSSSAGEMELSLIERQEVVEALEGKPVSLLRYREPEKPSGHWNPVSRRTRYRVFVALPILIENRVVGAVVISRTPLDVGKALYAIRMHLFKAGFVLVGVVLVMALLATHYINRPVKALIEQAGRVMLGARGKTKPIEKPVFKEASQLSEAISQMANTLENRTEYIKNFATAVSHEFKTPLTSLRGSIEILRDHFADMDAVEREKFLAILDDETDRLNTMVRRLLDLARAEVYKPGSEVTDIESVFKEAGTRFKARGMEVEVRIGPDVSQVAMAHENFVSIIDNLLENSLQHGGEGVRVSIKVDAATVEGRKMVEIILRDNGKGISPANAERVFRPFFTTTRTEGGSGLGLSIVKSLIEAHEGAITLLPATDGTSFKVCLPVDPTHRNVE